MKTQLKKIMSLAILAAMFFSGVSYAASSVLYDVQITRLQTFSPTSYGGAWTGAMLYINGAVQPGKNPRNTAISCEIWTRDSYTYATALTALASGDHVDVAYSDRGEGTHWCKVDYLIIIGN